MQDSQRTAVSLSGKQLAIELKTKENAKQQEVIQQGGKKGKQSAALETRATQLTENKEDKQSCPGRVCQFTFTGQYEDVKCCTKCPNRSMFTGGL